jgi:hypothetical protein
MSLLPFRLCLFYALGYSTRYSLNCALCALGQIIDRVGRNWNLLRGRVSGDCSHEAEHAHDTTDEKQRHPDEAAPKQTRGATTTESGKEAGHADDEENETDRCNDRTCDAQEKARSFVFWSL